MGLFDRFKRRVKEVSDEFDTDELTVEEDSVEGQQLASAKLQTEEETLTPSEKQFDSVNNCLLYTSPSPRDRSLSRMPSSA